MKIKILGKSLFTGLAAAAAATLAVPAAAAPMTAPQLKTAYTLRKNNKTSIEISWKASSGSVYQILRKNGDSVYRAVGNASAGSNTASFTDENVKAGVTYTYTVRRIIRNGNEVTYGNYDSAGLKVVTAEPAVHAAFTNFRAKITWKKVPGASYYLVYRKLSSSGKYSLLKKVSAKGSKASYTVKDTYYKTLPENEKKDLLHKKTYMDPSANPLHYTVRAVKEMKTSSGKKKVSFGAYSADGCFHMETPTIISVSVKKKSASGVKEKVKWGTVANADAYILYSGHLENGKTVWTRKKQIKAQNTESQSVSIKAAGKENYVSVQAVSQRDGKSVKSSRETGFTTAERKYKGKKILFIGDSISYGSPYTDPKNRHLYCYPKRVAQLTGVSYYNPSISGATLAYSESRYAKHGIYSLYEHVVLPVSRADYAVMPQKLGNTYDSSSFYYYDCVVLECGTNDYSWNVKTGGSSSMDPAVYSGAWNQTLTLIKNASNARVNAGKKPIKVVVLDLFYSDRIGAAYTKQTSRFEKKNSSGYTLKDYQKVIDKEVSSWNKKGLKIYQFKTDAYVNAGNIGTSTADHLHMSKYTAARLGNGLSAYLIRHVLK